MMEFLRRLIVAATVATTSLVGAGCGPLADESGDDPALITEDSSGPRLAVSPFEESLIGDGDASADDVDAALQAVVTCLDSKGFPGASYELHLPWGYSMDVQGSGANAAHTACEAQYLDAVSALFFDQSGPTDDEIASADDLAVKCLRDAGLAIRFDSDFAEVSSRVDIELAERCLVQAQDEIRASK